MNVQQLTSLLQEQCQSHQVTKKQFLAHTRLLICCLGSSPIRNIVGWGDTCTLPKRHEANVPKTLDSPSVWTLDNTYDLGPCIIGPASFFFGARAPWAVSPTQKNTLVNTHHNNINLTNFLACPPTPAYSLCLSGAAPGTPEGGTGGSANESPSMPR